MAFEVLDQNITQLFKNDDTFFIPRYQRNYVWRELHWGQLIKDMYRCWHYKNRLKKEQLFEITKEQLRENNQKDLPKFFDFFIQGSEYYYGIDSVVGDDIEKEVYEYFKLKRNKQVRSVLLALKMKYAEGILDIDSYHQYLIMLRNFWVTFNLDNGSSNKIDGDVYILSNEIYKSNKKGLYYPYKFDG